MQKAVEYAKEKCGGLNTVVNCAGIGIAMRILGKDGKAHPLDKFETVLKVCVCDDVIACIWVDIRIKC